MLLLYSVCIKLKTNPTFKWLNYRHFPTYCRNIVTVIQYSMKKCFQLLLKAFQIFAIAFCLVGGPTILDYDSLTMRNKIFRTTFEKNPTFCLGSQKMQLVSNTKIRMNQKYLSTRYFKIL